MNEAYSQLKAKLTALLFDYLPSPTWDTPVQNEQRIAIEVCKRHGMTPGDWKALTEAERVPWLQQTVDLLSTQTKPVPSEAEGKAKTSLDALALALFVEDTTRTKTDIAKLLKRKKTQSLSPKRCPKLHAAMAAAKAPDPKRRIRGSKTADGNLEAYEE